MRGRCPAARPNAANPPLHKLIAADAAWFDATFNGTPVRRAGLEGMRRNAMIAARNRNGESA